MRSRDAGLLRGGMGGGGASAGFPGAGQNGEAGGGFVLDETVRVLADNLSLARLLVAEFSDRYGVALRIVNRGRRFRRRAGSS